MASLLYACYQTLHEKGMTGMFLDGVSFGEQALIPLGKSQVTRQRCRSIISNISGLILTWFALR